MVAVCGATVQAARGYQSEEQQRKRNGYGLLIAAKEGCLDGVKLLIKDGVNLSARNKYSNTALIKAAKSGHMEIVRLLVAAGL